MSDEQWLAKDAIVRRLSTLTPSTPPDDALAFYDRWLALKATVRELDQLVTDAIIGVIEAQPRRELVVGTRRFFVGHRKETKCVDKAAAVQAILELLGPDLLSACLTAQPFKPAAVRAALTQANCADDFERLFRVTRKQSLGVDGGGEIIAIDDRFRCS